MGMIYQLFVESFPKKIYIFRDPNVTGSEVQTIDSGFDPDPEEKPTRPQTDSYVTTVDVTQESAGRDESAVAEHETRVDIGVKMPIFAFGMLMYVFNNVMFLAI